MLTEGTRSMLAGLTLDAASRLSFSLRHPVYAFRMIARDLVYSDDRLLASIAGVSHREIRVWRREPLRVPEFLSHLRRCGRALEKVKSIGASLYANKISVQYAVIRALKPDAVVETGVANGISSTYILLALEKNQKGQLHSIDIGDDTYLPPGGQTGWVVPCWLRHRWMLHLGDARALLAPLLAELGNVDVFIHDSLHTYDHMMFEFQTAYPHVRPGGVLFADDASWNSAFVQFGISVGVPRPRIVRGVGFLRKAPAP
jgi:predicted O-methyltransferase YrrM